MSDAENQNKEEQKPAEETSAEPTSEQTENTQNQPETTQEGVDQTGEQQPTEGDVEGEAAPPVEEDLRSPSQIEADEKEAARFQSKKKKTNAKPEIEPDFYYDYETVLSKPVISEESNLPENLLQLFHSFGYDCKKKSNLGIIDEDTLIFSAGNLVQIVNVKTKEQKYLKTLSGGAVGAIKVHPSRKYFAVGEKGNMPNINIFEYPSLKLYRILRQGTLKGYAFLDFDPAGNLLASQGAAPDFMLTIWDWKQETVMLRSKAFSQDIFKVTFSKYLKGILTSGGTGHIKFWKMASTFTGYKLQGDLGKFGKTEISDIEGYAELPDGKVLSGTEWGNMLLWDGGLIQTEICRRKNKPCHTGAIHQITLDEGDIYTIGEDGSVRVWDFETVDTAEPSEEGVKLEIEPLNELKVGNNVSLKSMVKDFADESTLWYAQDSNGAIWLLDLSFMASSENPRQLFTYHAGVINGLGCCPTNHLFATTADDGSVKVYNYTTFEILAQKRFTKGGTALQWLPTEIDPDGATVVSGFQDGVLRFLKVASKNPNANDSFTKSMSLNDSPYDLILFEVFKPHTKAITKIAIDSKNSIIATGSNDQTVFFFANSNNTRTPIGFVTLPSPVTFMTWTPREYANNCLLVCMKDGSVYEFEAPVLGKYDTTKSYLIELSLKCRKYKFKSIKSRLRHEEELERIRKEEEEKKKKEAEERRRRGILDDDDDKKKKKKKQSQEDSEENKEGQEDEKSAENPEEEEDSGAKKKDEWKPFIPEIPSKICWAAYSSPDTFWLSMDDYDAGYMYECKFLTEAERTRTQADKIDEPFKSFAVVKSDLTHTDDIPLTCMIQNKEKTFTLIGEKNGVLRIQPMDETKKLENLKSYWSYGFHDVDYGVITNICFSYDEKYLFSVGADSNIFGILFNSTLDDLEKAKQAKIKFGATLKAPKAVNDIDDPTAYSIEEAKQKSEYDKMISISESKKQEMRTKITNLRKLYKDLTVKNDQLVPRLKLGKNEFLLEESIKQQVLNQINEKIQLTYRELAWYSEKCRIMLDKLQFKFKDAIDCEHIVVFSFDNNYTVDSFRTIALPKDMENYKIELEKQYLAKLLEKQKNKDNIEAPVLIEKITPDNQPTTILDLNINKSSKSNRSVSIHSYTEELLAALDSQAASEDVHLQGLSAADQIKKIFGKLRGNTAARVERALKKMDERKLKRLKRKKEWDLLLSSRLPEGYENPEDLENIKFAEENLGDFKLKTSNDFIVPEEQRMNVYKAVERLMKIKEYMNHNQMLFNKKLLSLRDKKKDIVDEINKLLDRAEQIQYLLGEPLEKLMARPVLRIEEIPEKKYEHTRERLLEFKKELESKLLTQKTEDDSGGFGGFGAGAAKPTSGNKKANEQAQVDQAFKLTQANLEGLKPLWTNKEIMSITMQQILKAKEIALKHEMSQIIKSINEKIKLFDAELKVLRHEKARLSIFMKDADLRHVTIFEEFMLLRDFEKTENNLEQKLIKRKEEHLDVQMKLNDVQAKIDSKRKDIEKLDENQKKLTESFHQMIHDETKFGDYLTKVYKKKIKRKKKVEGAEEEEESEEESDESDTDEEDLDDEDNDSESETREQLDLDMCPTGLKQELYDQVCLLREKRLDLEELHGEEKKLLEQLKKDQDGLIKKSKLADNSLKQAKQELENFQKEKQKKINDLDIVVIMRLSQLQFLDNGRLPADLSKALVIDSHKLDRLQARIKELQVEKASEKKLFKNLKEHHHELIKDKKKMDEYVSKLDDVCNKMMADKFGRIVDLEKLELIVVNQQIEELKQKMLENEYDHEKTMQDWLSKINNEKDESIDLIKANTKRINEMVDLLVETRKTEKSLDAKQSVLSDDMAGSTKKEVEERQRLHTLVQLQAQEVEALKAEIAILSRKGGHILPPTQPPALNQVQTV